MQKAPSLKHVGANIRAVRLRAHLSQAELAARLGMRPGPLNCIEKGRNLPGARVLHALSRILGEPVDVFFTPPANGTVGGLDTMVVREAAVPYMVAEKNPLWHGPCALPARTGRELAGLPPQLCGMASELSDAFLALEDMSGAVKSAELPLGMAADRTEEGLQRLCGQVRRLLGISDAVIFDYLELFENAGLRIIFCRLPVGVGSISCHDLKNANAFIFLDDVNLNAERQLYLLAYELGRLYMHSPAYYPHLPRPQVGKDRRGKLFTEERAARRFAGLFLMPESAVCATVRQLGVRPDEWTLELLYRIKHRFGVSAEAFLYRLRELKLITSALEKDFKGVIYQYYAAHDNHEPGSSRRVLTPNGRIWDLALTAGRHVKNAADLGKITETLRKHGARRV